MSKPVDDTTLLERDEVLRALAHRAAYRSHIVMQWVCLPAAMILIFVVQDERWNIVGYTTFALYVASALIFEVNLAYTGVFRGIDELRRTVIVDKRTILRTAAWICLRTVVFFVVFGRLIGAEDWLADGIVQGLIAGVIAGSAYLYQWRHIVDVSNKNPGPTPTTSAGNNRSHGSSTPTDL